VLGPAVPILTKPGDVMFFHSNLLHTSGPNTSSGHRRNLVLAYNQVCNAPLESTFLPPPLKLTIVEDTDVHEKARRVSSIDKEFIRNSQDASTKKMTTPDGQ